MKNLPELKKSTVVLLSVVATVSVIGILVLLVSGSMRIGDIFDALKGMNPRLMGFMAMPFIFVAILIGRAWFSKREERMWKEAMKKTRAAREQKNETGNIAQ